MNWPVQSPEPRQLSNKDRRMIHFLLERRFGFPAPIALEEMPPDERDALVTDEVAIRYDDVSAQYERLGPEALKAEYITERKKLNQEASSYGVRPKLALADWLRKDVWHLREALALSLDIEPRPLLMSWGKRNLRLDKLAAKVAARLDDVERASWIGALPDPVPPPVFIAWASSNGLELPSALQEPTTFHRTVGQVDEELARVRQHLVETQAENARLRQTLKEHDKANYKKVLQMFAAVCIEKYGFSTHLDRNHSVRDIAAAVNKHALLVSNKNVLKYIRDAVSELPENRRPKIAEGDPQPE